MSQLEYDIAEFVINNRDEINDFLSHDILLNYKDLFEDSPEIFDGIILKYRCNKLIDYLAEHFPNEFENICLIVDEQFVKITLQ